jgi:hypothetical protein
MIQKSQSLSIKGDKATGLMLKQLRNNDITLLNYYVFAMNAISLSVFILFSYSIVSTQFIYYFKSIIFLFSLIHLFSIVASINCLLFKQSLSRNERRLIQLIQYTRELPLAGISFYSLTQFYVKQLNSNLNTINYYITLLIFIYLSSSGLLTCIIIETDKYQQKQRIFFKFIFRFFYFMSRWPGFILVISTLISKFHSSHLFIIVITLFISAFFLHFLWSLFMYCQSRRHQRLNGWTILFETLRGFIDFNENLIVFKHKSATVIVSFIFITFQLFSQMIAGYIWYYRALLLPVIKYSEASFYLNQIESKLEPFYLIRLEEEIIFKQICLISIVGCIVLTFLSSFIYYCYYYDYDDKIELPKMKFSDNYHFNNSLIVKNDLSLNDSSISGQSISTIFNINEYKMNFDIKHHKSTLSLAKSGQDDEEQVILLPRLKICPILESWY